MSFVFDRAFVLDLTRILNEDTARPGDIHRRSDGRDYQKQRDGSWKRMPLNHGYAVTKNEPEEPAPSRRASRTVNPKVRAALKDIASDIGDPDDGQHPVRFKGVGIVPGAGPWIDHVEGLPKDTSEVYFDKAAYKPVDRDRIKLHEQIYKAFLDPVKPCPPGQQKVALVMIGPPASGKSSIVESLGLDEQLMVPADADLVKDFLPEYEVGITNRARDAAKAVHWESAYLVEQIREKAIEQGKNLIADGTGSNLDVWADLIDKLKSHDYHVHVIMTDASLKTAMERADRRGQQSGRVVEPAVIQGLVPVLPANFMKLKDKAHGFSLFNTEGDSAKPVWTKTKDGGDEVLDPAAHEDFLRRAGVRESAAADIRRALREADEPIVLPSARPLSISESDLVAKITVALAQGRVREATLPLIFPPGEGTLMPVGDLGAPPNPFGRGPAAPDSVR